MALEGPYAVMGVAWCRLNAKRLMVADYTIETTTSDPKARCYTRRKHLLVRVGYICALVRVLAVTDIKRR